MARQLETLQGEIVLKNQLLKKNKHMINMHEQIFYTHISKQHKTVEDLCIV